MKKQPALYVAESKTGKGVFTSRKFEPGELILILKGKKVLKNDPIHLTQFGSYLIQTGYFSYIMPESPGVFLNHSCMPNAGIFKNRHLIAITKITAGDEISFDYSTTMDENYWTMDCACGTDECRYEILDFNKIPEEIQIKYLSKNIVQGFIAFKQKKKLNSMSI